MSKAKNKIDEKDILEFFKYSYFGDLKDPIEAASNRAYRDMCRTLNFDILPKKDKDTTISNLKKDVNFIFKKEIPIINEGSITSQKEFDTWHHGLCDNIIEKCKKIEKYKKTDNDKKEKIQLTYGQAQKWVNMTIKYLYILEVEGYSFDNIIMWLHIPIDNYIFDAVEKELEIDRPVDAWSRWDKYEEYLKYQKDIREEIPKKSDIDTPPLLWEFDNWLKVANGNNKN
ncbi:MAG: hypothetical protein HXL14_01870 [Parvimonas sp.]|nr:hypothetical protein [Parvimonas sp.]